MFNHHHMNEAWASCVGRLRGYPPIPSRNGPARELCGYSFRLQKSQRNWLTNAARKPSKVYAAGELAWYLSGDDSLAFIQHYAPSYSSYSHDGQTLAGAYGPRIMDQLPSVISSLRYDNCRRAVITIRRPGENSGLDVPCTLSLQFLNRKGKLHLITTMRSNDAWLGMPYDVYCFTTIQGLIASHFELEPGWYLHQVGSVHLYEKDYLKARERQTNLRNCPESYTQPPGTNIYSSIEKMLEIEKAYRQGLPPVGVRSTFEDGYQRMFRCKA